MRGNEWCQRAPASTGPRSGERGDNRRESSPNRRNRSFNGAALGRARRWNVGRCGKRLHHHGFNGAALGRARRSGGDAFPAPAYSSLQRGRARESAEMGPALMTLVRAAWLQRGRARESAEIRDSFARQETVRQASTGPRSGERGDQVSVEEYDETAGWLQRGRARESAEIASIVAIGSGTQWLQRGRARESAEMRLLERVGDGPAVASTGPRSGERGDRLACIALARPTNGFNGAALGRARRSAKYSVDIGRDSQLQRGRARESAEMNFTSSM